MGLQPRALQAYLISPKYCTSLLRTLRGVSFIALPSFQDGKGVGRGAVMAPWGPAAPRLAPYPFRRGSAQPRRSGERAPRVEGEEKRPFPAGPPPATPPHPNPPPVAAAAARGAQRCRPLPEPLGAGMALAFWREFACGQCCAAKPAPSSHYTLLYL